MAKEYGPKGIHVEHIVVDGAIAGDKINKNLPDIAKKLGCHPDTLHKRYRNGLRGSDLLAPGTPGRIPQIIEHKGQLVTFQFLENQSGVLLDTLYRRYRRGIRGEALTAKTL